mmetsp:Transcript_9733/g.23830  ORF Transcript_9733/g.23830 Transcript_9733/m.23830 type:complete len:208 (+) Transcript_9733:1305-1928(+)
MASCPSRQRVPQVKGRGLWGSSRKRTSRTTRVSGRPFSRSSRWGSRWTRLCSSTRRPSSATPCLPSRRSSRRRAPAPSPRKWRACGLSSSCRALSKVSRSTASSCASSTASPPSHPRATFPTSRWHPRRTWASRSGRAFAAASSRWTPRRGGSQSRSSRLCACVPTRPSSSRSSSSRSSSRVRQPSRGTPSPRSLPSGRSSRPPSRT